MGRGRHPGRIQRGSRSLTTRVWLVHVQEAYPTIDYSLVHLIDCDNVLGRNQPDCEGSTLCGAHVREDDVEGFYGSPAEVEPGHPVCPNCVRVAHELEEQSVYIECPYRDQPLIWNEDSARWEVGRYRPRTSPDTQSKQRSRVARGLVEE